MMKTLERHQSEELTKHSFEKPPQQSRIKKMGIRELQKDEECVQRGHKHQDFKMCSRLSNVLGLINKLKMYYDILQNMTYDLF